MNNYMANSSAVKPVAAFEQEDEDDKYRVGEIFVGYCQNTSLHGWAYLVDKEGPLRKAFWALTIVTSFCICGYLVGQTARDWAEEPVMTTVDSFTYPAEKVQYPTITICQPRTQNITRLDQVR